MPRSEKSKKLAEEIYQVFKQVEKIIERLSEYPLGAKEPSWLPLNNKVKKGEKSPTIRDYVLLNYAKDQHPNSDKEKDLLLTCALSFDVVSSGKHFDIDHFFPQSEMMTKLNEIEKDQILLREVKSELRKLLIQKQGAKEPKEASSYADKVVNRLINRFDDKGHILKATGLKHIYYNCPSNLWPISGPVNRTKGKKESIESSVSFALRRIGILLGAKQVRILAKKTAQQFGIPPEEIKIKTAEKLNSTIELLSNAILNEFNKQCKQTDEEISILPSIKEGNKSIFMLEFFQSTPIGFLSKKFATETAINAKKSLKIARDIAYHAMVEALLEDGNETAKTDIRSNNKAAQKFLKILHKSLQSNLNENLQKHNLDLLENTSLPSDSSSSSLDPKVTSSLESIGARGLQYLEQEISKRKRKRSERDVENAYPKSKHLKNQLGI